MANLLLADIKADVLDRMDNSVLSGSMSEANRTKLSATKRLNNAIREAFAQFVISADLKAISQMIEFVSLVESTDITDVEGASTYDWPLRAYQERADGGLVSVIINGQERQARESTPIESLRMQANNSFYGTAQKVFTLDPANRRVYAPSGVTARARIVAEPNQVLAIAGTQVLTLSGVTESASTTFSISDGTTTITLDTGAFESAADLATRLYAAINASAPFKLVATAPGTATFSLSPKAGYVPSAITATITTTDGDIGYTPASFTFPAGAYTELPISDIYHDTIVLATLGALVKSTASSALALGTIGTRATQGESA